MTAHGSARRTDSQEEVKDVWLTPREASDFRRLAPDSMRKGIRQGRYLEGVHFVTPAHGQRRWNKQALSDDMRKGRPADDRVGLARRPPKRHDVTD